jgi:cobalt-zinc-cadmium efflux system outer membrane protein
MKGFLILPRQDVLLAMAVVVLVGGRVVGQTQGGDEPVFTPNGGSTSLLGSSPGAGGAVFSNLPGTGGLLGGRPGPTTPKGIPTSVTSPSTAIGPTALQAAITAPQPEPITPATGELYGTLEIPAGAEDDGPENGLTLDAAIDITLERSLDLRSKFYELPQARADILQASLRANPVFYQDGQLLPYPGYHFSRAVPGGPSQYDTNVTFLLDIMHKRQARTYVAQRAEKVLEAQYQEAVRQRIDDIYDAYVLGALAARQTLRYARQSAKALESLATTTEQLYRGKSVSLGDLNRVRIQVRRATLGQIDAEAAYRKARLDLGSLMNLTQKEIEALELRGSIRDTASPPPPIDTLQKIALDSRPDIAAYRLGVTRAEADVRLARANRFSDVFLLFQPYTYQDNSPYGLKSAVSYALGVTVPLPIYNRNQGGIQRAVLNVSQTQTQLADVERQALIDVEKAVQEYEVTRREVDALSKEVIPEASQVRDEAYKLYRSGERSVGDFISAQLEFNQVVKQFLDTAIRHRRSMLGINTAVGRRVLP